VTSYAIKVSRDEEQQTRGPYDTRDAVTEALQELQVETGDNELRGVSVWKMTEGGSAGEEVPISHFI
jgi:hypothetical protein